MFSPICMAVSYRKYTVTPHFQIHLLQNTHPRQSSSYTSATFRRRSTHLMYSNDRGWVLSISRAQYLGGKEGARWGFFLSYLLSAWYVLV
jgi:hypothetical protein